MPQHCMVLVGLSLGPILSEGVVDSFLSSLGPLSALGLYVLGIGEIDKLGNQEAGRHLP